MPKALDAHIYAPGSQKAVKHRLQTADPAVAMHVVSRDVGVPRCAVVHLVAAGGDVLHRFAVTPKGPARLSARESDCLIKERDPARRMRLLSEIIRDGFVRR